MKTNIISREEVESKVFMSVADSGVFDTEAMEILSNGDIWNGEKMSVLVSINSASVQIGLAGKESHEATVTINGQWNFDEAATIEAGTKIFSNLEFRITYQATRIENPMEALTLANRLQLAAKLTDKLQGLFEGVKYSLN